MNILVTGGAGYIGSNIVKLLLSSLKGMNLIVIDNLSTGIEDSIPNDLLYKIDLSCLEEIEKVFQEKKFDTVIHCAASVVVSDSVKDPISYYLNNSVNTINLINLCNKYKIKKFIFSSTAAVYGEIESGIVNETSPLNPLNPYGMSKLMSEKVIIDNAKANKDFKYCIFRYFNVAGADIENELGQRMKNATHLIKLASEVALGKKDTLYIYGDDYPTKDGSCIRDYIHVTDLAQAHLEAINFLEYNESDIFNCGYGKGYSVFEVVKMMKKVSLNDFKTKIIERRDGDSSVLIADNTKILKKMGWKPKYNNLEYICKTAYEWEKKLT